MQDSGGSFLRRSKVQDVATPKQVKSLESEGDDPVVESSNEPRVVDDGQPEPSGSVVDAGERTEAGEVHDCTEIDQSYESASDEKTGTPDGSVVVDGRHGHFRRSSSPPMLPWKTRLAIVVAFAVFLSSLIAASPMRGVGDGGEYLIMADKIGHFERPRVAQEEFAQYTDLFARVGGYMGIGVAYRIGDPGPFEFNHFWAYSAAVAPVLRFTDAMDWNPVRAFTITNMAFMLAALWIVLRRLHWLPTLLVFAGPAVWWIDKTHSEVFTFSLLAITFALLRERPVAAMLCAAVAAAHNFPIGLLVGAIAAYALLTSRKRWKSPWFWGAVMVSGFLSILSPLYFKLTIDTTSPQSLNGGVDPHIPSLKQYLLPLIDLNNGLLIAAPILSTVIAAALVLLIVRIRKTSWLTLAVPVVALSWFLFSFAQTGNFNHGATPSMTRYGNWILPMAILVFLEVQRTGGLPRWLRNDPRKATAIATTAIVAVGVSAMLAVVSFHPRISDGLHRPTPLANWVWNNHPSWDNPVVEVFWERTSQFEGSAKSTANASCTKVLEVRGVWPEPCGSPPPIPEKCLQPASNACYANRRGDGWEWVQVSGVPGYDTVAVDVGDIQQRLKKDGVSRIN